MNMSDDIASSVIQTSTRSIETAAHMSTSILEAIIRLMKYIEESQKEKRRNKTDVHNQEITSIKGGQVSTKNLVEYCRKNHEKLVSSEIGISKEEASILAAKCKKCSIPIAFRNEKGKDNIYICLRESDTSMFKQLQTEMIKEKLESRPQELRNFKCNEWEIPFINAELKKNDLSAQFAQTKNGEYLAIYEAKDAKAIEIARSQFAQKASEVEKNIVITRENDGFIIKDKITGSECSVNNNPNRTLLSKDLQQYLGYDKNKADIVAQKFGQEMLLGEEKARYFSDEPTSAFSYVSKVSWENENKLARLYDCYYITPKEDGISRVVFQDEDRFAVLNPPRQTKATMRDILKVQLGITNSEEQNALIEKAEHVAKVNAKYRAIKGNNEDIHIHESSFSKEAFDLTNVAVVSNMARTDEQGNTFTKTQPIDRVSTSIERKGVNTFEVKSTAFATEHDTNNKSYEVTQQMSLVLSLSRKKNAIEQLKEMYISQGVPESAAKNMAKSVFQKAELQSAEKVISIEKSNADSITVIDTNTSKLLPAKNRIEAIDAIEKEYHIPRQDAEIIVDKATDDSIIAPVATNSNDNVIKSMTRDEFAAAGLPNEQYLIAQQRTDHSDGDQAWTDETNLYSKDGHYYLHHDSGWSSNLDEYSEITRERASEFMQESSTKFLDNGHLQHPDGNMLLNKTEKLADSASKATDKANELIDDMEKAITRGGR